MTLASDHFRGAGSWIADGRLPECSSRAGSGSDWCVTNSSASGAGALSHVGEVLDRWHTAASEIPGR